MGTTPLVPDVPTAQLRRSLQRRQRTRRPLRRLV